MSAPGFSNDFRTNVEGRVYLYLGSSSGPSLIEDWSVTSVNQQFPAFGISVASAGDVNADGFDDILVGAARFDSGETDEGMLFLYHGSASGASSTEAWTAESNQTFANLGSSVSSAGDVNGDGFDDVIAGAPGFANGQTNEGIAFVYHGFPDPAMGAVFNGSGINPLCLSSMPPVIGQNWISSIDTSVRPAPGLAILVVQARSSSGTFLASGELLLDLSSSRFITQQKSVTGPTESFTLPVPADPAFAGLTATAHGIVFGGGYTLCNAYSFMVGF